ncbi:MAG: hypothetical protein KDD42_01720 [Bdellovibrionales bacterium]|nr:hypothetical protein [Bdellovibrionales bacterium]
MAVKCNKRRFLAIAVTCCVLICSLSSCRKSSHDDDDNDNEQTANLLFSEFRWNPADQLGRAAIFVDVEVSKIEVNGSIAEDFEIQASEDNGSVAYGSFSGCAYGERVIVNFLDDDSRPIHSKTGIEVVVVPDGCSPFSLKLK